jgi:glyceraldehyde 3-phosphate dehydrogenase
MSKTQNQQHSLVIASKMVPSLHHLYTQRQVVIYLKGNGINFAAPIQIVKLHSQHLAGISLEHLAQLIETISAQAIAGCSIDLAALAVQDDTQAALSHLNANVQAKRDIVLYGFGRIGRLLARLLTSSAMAPHAQLRAIVVRNLTAGALEQRARLLANDSIHGEFAGDIRVDTQKSQLIINGYVVDIINASDPSAINYSQYGIEDALIVDNTGVLRDDEALAVHLQATGATQVLLTAPASGAVPNIVYGINSQEISAKDSIVSGASCTTNAIAPVLKAIDDKFSIVSGHLETVHSYTNDQNLLDNHHKSNRRGRSAAINMVITATGAAKALSKVIPNLAGKLTGNAIRVPTANISIAVLHLSLAQSVSLESVNEYLTQLAQTPVWQEVMGVSTNPDAVSTDFIGASYAGIVDLQATIAKDNNLVLYVWYDNEHSYSAQVVRLIQQLSGGVLPSYPSAS